MSQFLHTVDNDDTTLTAISRVFSENSRAKNVDNNNDTKAVAIPGVFSKNSRAKNVQLKQSYQDKS